MWRGTPHQGTPQTNEYIRLSKLTTRITNKNEYKEREEECITRECLEQIYIYIYIYMAFKNGLTKLQPEISVTFQLRLMI